MFFIYIIVQNEMVFYLSPGGRESEEGVSFCQMFKNKSVFEDALWIVISVAGNTKKQIVIIGANTHIVRPGASLI